MGSPSSKAALTGFIGNTHDALIVFEGCRRGILPRAQSRLSEAERRAIKSGDVFVFNEDESKIKRWTDGKRWSPSRILNNFLIYREVIAEDGDEEGKDQSSSKKSSKETENSPPPVIKRDPHSDSEVDELSNKTLEESNTTTIVQPHSSPRKFSPVPISVLSASEQVANQLKAMDPKMRNITGGLELIPNRKEDGLIKKTISVAGLHMISYYTVADVLSNHLTQPSARPDLLSLDISHPFLMAQFFRHPPQVTFDSEGIPHFAGITDDEPMLRKPPSQQRRSKKEQAAYQQQLLQEQQSQTYHQQQIPGMANPVHGVHRFTGPPGSAQRHTHEEPPYLTNIPKSKSPVSTSPVTLSQPPQLHHPIPGYSTTSLAHLTTHHNPLLPSTSTSRGPHRSATSLSTPDTSSAARDVQQASPLLGSSAAHSSRHEPYRIPPARHRHSLTEASPTLSYTSISDAIHPYSRQASLPGSHVDLYRYGSDSQRSPQPYHLPQLGGFTPIESRSSTSSDHYPSYTTQYPHESHYDPPQRPHPVPLPMESPQSFYSAPSYHSSQASTSEVTQSVAYGSAQHIPTLHTSDASPVHSSRTDTRPSVFAQPTYPHQPVYSQPLHHSANMGMPLWYNQEHHPSLSNRQSSSSHLSPTIDPTESLSAVSHLSGVLPETTFSPLLPSSAAYATDQQLSPGAYEFPEDIKPKMDPHYADNHYYPQGQGTTGHGYYDSYITGVPPPSYAYPMRPSSTNAPSIKSSVSSTEHMTTTSNLDD